jgi:hypothetical protein
LALGRAELGDAERALAAARAIDSAAGCAQALNLLIPKLPQSQSLVAQAAVLDRVPQVGRPDRQVEVLAGLAPNLSASLLAPALAVARAIGSDWRRADALSELAVRVPEAERSALLREALEAVRPQGPKALTELSQRLARLGFSAPALEAGRSIRDDRDRAEALRKILRWLPEADRPQGYQEALAAAREIAVAWRRVNALIWLASDLPGDLREEALTEARRAVDEIRSEKERDQAWDRVWAAQRKERAEDEIPAAGLAEEPLRERLETAQRISDRREYWRLALSLAPTLEEPSVRELLAEVRGETRWLPAELGAALAALAPRLPEELLRPAVDGILKGSGIGHLALLDLAELTPFLPEPTLRWALDVALEIRIGLVGAELIFDPFFISGKEVKEMRQEFSVKALEKLAVRIAEIGYSAQALKAVRKFGDRHRFPALLAIAPHLAEPFKQQAIEGVLAASRTLGVPAELRALLELAPHLSEAHREEALSRVLGFPQAEQRLAGLVVLAAHLSGAAQKKALQAAQGIKKHEERLLVLALIAERLPEESRNEILQDQLATASGKQRISCLRTFLRYLPEPHQWEVLRDALDQHKLKLKDLLVIARQSAGAVRETAFREIVSHLAARTVDERLDVFQELGPFVEEIPGAELLGLLEDTLQHLAGSGRPALLRGLTRLGPVAVGLGGGFLATEIFRAAQGVERWWT